MRMHATGAIRYNQKIVIDTMTNGYRQIQAPG
jgi:hypothetical protein